MPILDYFNSDARDTHDKIYNSLPEDKATNLTANDVGTAIAHEVVKTFDDHWNSGSGKPTFKQAEDSIENSLPKTITSLFTTKSLPEGLRKESTDKANEVIQHALVYALEEGEVILQ